MGAVIAAAGVSQRMGGVDKLFAPLLGKPLLAWTVDTFQTCLSIHQIALVVSEGNLGVVRRLVAEGGWSKVVQVCPGGERRQDSVARGLEALTPCDLIAIHDGARPLITHDIIRRGISAARRHGAAVAAVPVTDTIKVVTRGLVAQTPERDRLWAVQTPQVFRSDIIAEAYRRAKAGATDDASLVERLGHRVRVYRGSYENIKVTAPEDLALAEAILKRRVADFGSLTMRVGSGYDVHRLEKGRPLMVGGVEVPFGRGLAGHSDGDVLIHAIIDALLGAAGLPDIGQQFPDTDPGYKNVSSLILLARARELVEGRGFRIGNIDATLLAQSPQMAPHVAAMKERIGEALGIAASQIGIKAKTGEGLGFIGQGEGMAALAVALLVA